MPSPIEVRLPGLEFYLLFCGVMLGSGLGLFLLLRNRSFWLARWKKFPRLLALNAAAAWFFLTVGFVGLETYYRFLYDTTDSFNYTFVSKQWFARHYRYNAAKLRDNVEYLEAIPPGTRRVAIIGDSFTVGHGLNNVDDRFANLLRKKHPEWDVQVFAAEGLDTGAEIDGVQRLVDRHYPLNLVVLVYCLNDISDMMPEWIAAINRIYDDETPRPWLVNHSFFADAYYYRLKARLDPNIPNYYSVVRDAYRGPLWETQKRRLAKLRAMVESLHGRLVVVTFPFLNALGPQYEYQPAHDQLAQWWRSQNVPHLDLLPVFRDQSPAQMVVNRLDAHPNERAHALAAAALDTFLETELKSALQKP